MTTGVRLPLARSSLQRLDPAQRRHLDVEQDQVARQLRGAFDSLPAGADRRDHLHPAAREQLLDALAHERVVVDEEHAHR